MAGGSRGMEGKMNEEEAREGFPESPWKTGSPGPWMLKVFGGSPKGAYAWLSKIVLFLAVLSLGLFSVTRLMLIHWVFLVPASLGSLLALGVLYIFLEMRRRPVLILELREEGLSVRRPGEEPRIFPTRSILLRDFPEEHRFELATGSGGEALCSVSRNAVRDVSLYETIRRYLSLSPARRPPIPSPGPSRARLYRWFTLGWGLIIGIMILWALYENYAAPRSYEPFSNP